MHVHFVTTNPDYTAAVNCTGHVEIEYVILGDAVSMHLLGYVTGFTIPYIQ